MHTVRWKSCAFRPNDASKFMEKVIWSRRASRDCWPRLPFWVSLVHSRPKVLPMLYESVNTSS